MLNRRSPPQAQDGAIRLHLGCGKVDHPKFTNIDLLPYPHVHYLRPIDDLKPFAAESVDLIYASHCLEHFPFRKVPAVLREWHRVLKPGGTLRLSVPNFDTVVDAYLASGREIESVHQVVVGGQDYKHNFHFVLFNRRSLTAALEQCGFVEVRHWVPGSEEFTTFDDFSRTVFEVGSREIPVSLNLEARKTQP